MKCPNCKKEVEFKPVNSDFSFMYECPECSLKLSVNEISIYDKEEIKSVLSTCVDVAHNEGVVDSKSHGMLLDIINATDFTQGIDFLIDRNHTPNKAIHRTLHILYCGNTIVGMFKNSENAEALNKLNGNSLVCGEVVTDLF